jgi:hypothetical protein
MAKNRQIPNCFPAKTMQAEERLHSKMAPAPITTPADAFGCKFNIYYNFSSCGKR